MNNTQETVPEETTTETIPRTIDVITAEINYYKQQTVQNIIEIGKRLIEAKGRLQHGEWTAWLEHQVEFSERTARNFMKIASEYSNRQPVADLPYTKLLALLQVPCEEREAFMAESHVVNGEDKTVQQMSKRELEKVIKERDQEKKRADEAEEKAKKSEKDFNEVGKIANDRQKQIVQLQNELFDFKNQPIDVAIQEPTKEQIEAIRRAEQEKANRKTKLLEKENEQLKAQKVATESTFSEENTEDATEAFCDAVESVFTQFNSMLQRSAPSAIKNYLPEAIASLEGLLGKLRQSHAYAENIVLADEEVDLPEDLQ